MKIIDNYKKLNRSARAALWYLVCNVVQKGIQFITIPIYMHLLSSGQYGDYNVFMSWRDILIIPITLNLYCGIFTKAMVDYDADRERYTSSMQGLSTTITLCFFSIYLLFADRFSEVFIYSNFVSVLLFAYFLFFPAYSFWTVRQRVECKYISLIIVTLIQSFLVPLVSILLVYLTDLNDEAVVIGTLLVPVLFGLFFYIYHFIQNRSFFVKEYWIHGLVYNIPLIPHYLSLIVLAQSDRIMIKSMCGSDKAGIYSAAYQISSIINIVVTAINATIVPWLYERFKTNRYNEVKVITNRLCILMGIITSLAMLVAPDIITLIGKEEYYEAIWIIPAVVVSSFLSFCTGFYTTVEFYYSKTKYIMVASSLGALLNLGLNFCCIREFGYVAAGYTTLVCYSLFLIMHFCFVSRISRRLLARQKIYDDKKIFLLVLIMLVFMIICVIAYGHILFRYVICGIILLICLVLREKLLEMVKNCFDK